ncbi:MAG: DUF4912 domain-containing protein [Spirochaetaceae bacterium]|jgi:hypothetical protein|nr:DUF4912 domain-containing protein [Spirochaetaceae bacterium]
MASLWKDTTIHSFSRAYLESFTSQELLTVAAQLAVDLSSGLSDRVQIIGEILDAVDERVKPAAVQGDERERNSAEMEAAQDPKVNPFLTVRIPERYNITYIKALVRDPLWFFVFWEVKESLLEKFLKTEDFEGLCLRINALKKAAVFASYSVSVGNNDKAWYLDFPTEGDEFFVELCARIGGREDALAKTRAFRQPGILPACEGDVSPLAALSGIRDLPILREKTRENAPKERVP